MAEATDPSPDKLPGREECGLAFSGGGSRSATICLGILAAMAGVTDPQHTDRRLLQRFKYLSTVSGGGFTGAMFGRLFQSAADNPGYGWSEINALLSGENGRLHRWLRNSTRYLAPKGIGNGLAIFFSLLRSFVATQFEVGILFLWFGSLMVLPHLLLRQELGCLPDGTKYLNIGAHLSSAWWWLVPLPLFGGVSAMWAYWFSRGRRNGAWGDWLGTTLFGLLLGAWFWREGLQQWSRELDSSAGDSVGFLLPFGIGAVLLAGVAGALLSRINPAPPHQARSAYTRLLALNGSLGLGIVALALLDFGSWRLMLLLQGEAGSIYAAVGFGLTGLLVLLARVTAPLMQQALESGGKQALSAVWLANTLGFSLLLALLLVWATVAQYLVFGHTEHGLMATGSEQWPSYWRWSSIFALPALYMLLSRANIEQLNLSSLIHFYSGRLSATYLSVGKHDFWGTLQGTDQGKRYARVGAEFEDDDVAFSDYRPDSFDGPVHLINACIRQTVDDRIGLSTVDRKGVALSVSSEGLEYGNWAARSGGRGDVSGLTLAQWVAVSGAAVSSGMDSSTRPGLAALMFLSGLRVGYWLENPLRQERAYWSGLFRNFGPKYAALLSELLGRFPGLRSPYWYLSDGGYFDNTGVYALLKRKLKLIVLADCGADPLFLFGDLENLMRKAKSDLDVDIEFIDPESIPHISRNIFGTPYSITPDPGDQHLLLARIRYSDGASGLLLVLKPRRLMALPFEAASYADRHPAFPQQTTVNQFLDEAQWESYFALGKTLGASVTSDLLALLHAAEPVLTPEVMSEAAVGSAVNAIRPEEAVDLTWLQRSRRVIGSAGVAGAVGASVSFSAVSPWVHSALDLLKNDDVAANAQHAQYEKIFFDDYRDAAHFIEKVGPQWTTTQKVDLRARLDQLALLATELDRQAVSQSMANLLARVRVIQRDAPTAPPTTAGQPVQPDPLGRESLAELGKLLDSSRTRFPEGDSANLRYWFWSGQPLSCVRPEAFAATLADKQDSAQLQLQRPLLLPPDPAPSKVPSCADRGGQPLRLFIQIYDEADRHTARRFAVHAIDRGLVVPGIENVSATAKRKQKATPFVWDRRTWVLHSPEERQCVWGLADEQDRVLNLPSGLKTLPGVIELWIPPIRNGSEQ